eukprot:scaffold83085_cov24-Tisochrysis_lutea.AAC.5
MRFRRGVNAGDGTRVESLHRHCNLRAQVDLVQRTCLVLHQPLPVGRLGERLQASVLTAWLLACKAHLGHWGKLEERVLLGHLCSLDRLEVPLDESAVVTGRDDAVLLDIEEVDGAVMALCAALAAHLTFNQVAVPQ